MKLRTTAKGWSANFKPRDETMVGNHIQQVLGVQPRGGLKGGSYQVLDLLGQINKYAEELAQRSFHTAVFAEIAKRKPGEGGQIYATDYSVSAGYQRTFIVEDGTTAIVSPDMPFTPFDKPVAGLRIDGICTGENPAGELKPLFSERPLLDVLGVRATPHRLVEPPAALTNERSFSEALQRPPAATRESASSRSEIATQNPILLKKP